MINALKNSTKLGASPHRVLMQPREKLINYKLYTKKCVFCPIAQNFLRSALLPAYNVSATMAMTYSTYNLRNVPP